MPLVQGRKRRSGPEEDESPQTSPEPQTQRRRLQQPEAEEDCEADEHGSATQPDGLDDMVKKLVRLALACEFQRRPIRRTDVSEKVLGANGRQFRNVFNAAQLQLQAVFGMQMVELPAKEKPTLQQRRAAQKAPPTSKAVTSWVLTTTLPPAFRSSKIINPPAAPSAAEEERYTSIYTLLVSLIMLSGGSLPDTKMDRYLSRLNIQDSTPIRDYDKTEKLLKRLEKDGYIIKVRESTGTGEDDMYWIVGPRGKVEVGENGVQGLTRAVFGPMETEAAEDELERKIQRSLGISGRPTERREGRVNGQQTERGRPGLQVEGNEEDGRGANGVEEADDDNDDDDDEQD